MLSCLTGTMKNSIDMNYSDFCKKPNKTYNGWAFRVREKDVPL